MSPNHQAPLFEYVPLRDRLLPVPTAREQLEHPQETKQPHLSTIVDWMRRPWFQLRDKLHLMVRDPDTTRVMKFLREELKFRSPREDHVEALREVICTAQLWARPGGWRPGAVQSFYRCPDRESLLHYLTKAVAMRVRTIRRNRARAIGHVAVDKIPAVPSHYTSSPEEILIANESANELESWGLEAWLGARACSDAETQAIEALVADLSERERLYLELWVCDGSAPAKSLRDLGEVYPDGRPNFSLHQSVERRFRRRGLRAVLPTRARRRRASS